MGDIKVNSSTCRGNRISDPVKGTKVVAADPALIVKGMILALKKFTFAAYGLQLWSGFYRTPSDGLTLRTS